MKKFIFIAIFFILNINTINGKAYLTNSLDELTNNLNINQEFIENGVKLNYTINLNKEQVLNIILENYNVNSEFGYSGNFKYKDMEISYSIWSEEKTKLSVQIINSNKEVTINQIVNNTNKIFNSLSFDKVYKYSKYKVISYIDDNSLFLESKKINNIDIYNGNVEKRLLQDNTEVSIAHMKYNTGDYLILGTPVIFVTY